MRMELEDMTRAEEVLRKYRDRPDMLLHALQEIQGIYTCLPPSSLSLASRELGLPLSRVFQVATFYAALSLVPRGRHIAKICMGTACHLRGAEKVASSIYTALGIRQGEVTPDGEYGVETVNCLGACSLAPVVVLDTRYVGKVKPRKVHELFPERVTDPPAVPAPKVSQEQGDSVAKGARGGGHASSG